MSSVLDERDAYLKSPYFKKHEYSDFSPFYITITVCTVIGLTIFLINIFLGCCSKYSEYWNDRHTGNRWIVSLWTATPHQQPSLDYSELQDVSIVPEQKIIYQHQHPVVYQHVQGPTAPPEETYELKKRESAI